MENLSGQCYNDEQGGCCNNNLMCNSKGEQLQGGGGGGGGGDKSTTRSSSTTGSSSAARRNKSRWDQPETSHSTGSLLSSMERFVQTVDDMNETILVPCRLMDLQFDETFVPPPPAVAPLLNPLNGFGGTGATGKRVGDVGERRIVSNLHGVDLYQFYSVLNNIKNDLMWGRKSQQQSQQNNNGGIPGGPPPHLPTLSTSSSAASVISTVSSSMLTSSSNSSTTSSSNNHASLSQVPNGTGDGQVKGHARRPSTVSTTSSTSASDTEFSELNEDSGVEAEHEDDCAQNVADAFHHHLNGLQQCLGDLTIAADYVTNRYNSTLGGGL